MNRREYMDALAEKLSFLPEETRNAALSFYGEMLDDRMEDGMDEQSAVAAMESADTIAARLRAENPAGEEKRAEEQPADDWDAATEKRLENDAARFSDLAEQVMKSVSKAMENVPQWVNEGVEKARTGMEKAMEMAENAVNEAQQKTEKTADDAQREAHWTDRFSDAPERVGDYERRVFTCPASSLRAVDLSVHDMPVCVRPAGNQEAALIYYTCDREPYTARVENGTLTLINPEKAGGRGGFSFSIFGGGFHALWNRSSPTVYLELPADALVDLKIKTGNGSVRMDGMNALCQVELTTSNSRIDLKNICCKALEMATSNGRLNLEHVESKQHIQGATSNARIEARDVTAKGNVKLVTSNGRITVSKAHSGCGLTLTTSNSSLYVEKLAADQITLRSSNGEIRGTLPGRQSDWAIDSRTSNGRNSLPTSQPGAKSLAVHTSNAGIHLDFEAGK